MRKILLALAIAGALSGCAGGQQLAPPGMPTIAAITAQQAQLGAIAPADVPGFYRVGLLLAQEQCGGYFDSAVLAALKAAGSARQATLISGLAAGLMGLAGAPGAATAALGLASGMLGTMASSAQADSLAGSDPAATATLVGAAQAALIAAEQNPATAADAYAAVYAVTRACSPAGIRGLEEQAIAAAPNHLSVSGADPSPLAPAFAPRALSGPSAALPSVRVR